MNKKIILTAFTIIVLGVGLFGATNTMAQTPTGTAAGNPISSLVQKIAQKFGLNQADVQDVFDQEQQERRARMETRYIDELDQYVKDGKITEAQKQLILAKHKEMEANIPHKNDKQNWTLEQRKAQMSARKADLQVWAKQNGIDLQYLMPLGRGMRGRMGNNK